LLNVWILSITTALWAGCNPPGPTDAGTDAARDDAHLDAHTDARDGARDGDASSSGGPEAGMGGPEAGMSGPEAGPGGCEQGCHIDCFGSSVCWNGGVYVLPWAPRPCCHPTDYGPLPQACFVAPWMHCASGHCDGTPDPRYAACLPLLGTPIDPTFDTSARAALLPLYCAEGAPKHAGDSCTTDANCRPAASDVAGALHCDTAAGTCVEQARPPAPPHYGESCGLTSVASNTEVVTGTSCGLCHVAADADAGCVRQACTMPCHFDEDCPDGSVCLCATRNTTSVLQFCARVTDRTSAAGRTAWLSCGDGAADGGASDATTGDADAGADFD
jgi:hypothetical protein